jgi:hypothetical protein
LTAYHLAAVTRGATDPIVQLDHLVKTKVPKYVSQQSRRAPDDHIRLMRRVEAAAKVIEAGAFYPTGADSWTCCAKWCGYWENHCAFGRRKAVTVGLIDPSKLTSRMAERRP